MSIILAFDSTFELTGNGDVLEPEVGVMGVGSGGTYALAAALVISSIICSQHNLSFSGAVDKTLILLFHHIFRH